ncbi:hypothetical protein P280DRAFT_517884 [Massarina eburnea CBS 473.64]|uniref:Uncharacterized protein n=1 Tax=Massarina eburnea CBS 473.64 TaxID=1395130 RepID=A0A6A6RZH9_9PLEO|nr:hypothetical protein P280DRAFT_517884 [Massarina eburnea CBS 473.64]
MELDGTPSLPLPLTPYYTGLDAADIAVLRALNPTANAADNFFSLFNTLKVSFCRASIEVLVRISTIDILAEQVEHLVFGTETLDQYLPYIKKSDADGGERENRQRNVYIEAAREDMNRAAEMVDELKEAVFAFVNLKTVTVEDRPAIATNEVGWRESLGYEKVRNKMGIDMRWNGPYLDPRDEGPGTSIPRGSKMFVYASVFTMVRDLDTVQRRVALNLSIAGYQVALRQDEGEEQGVQVKRYFALPFDPCKALPRYVFKRNVKKIEIRDVDTDVQIKKMSDLVEFLRRLEFHSVSFVHCALHFGYLDNAFAPFNCLDVRNCENVTGLGDMLYQHRYSLRYVSIVDVSMQLDDPATNENHWAVFFKALCEPSAFQKLKMKDLRTGVEEGEEDVGEQLRSVTWEGNSGIQVGALRLLKTVEGMSALEQGLPAVLNLMEGQAAYEARSAGC